MSVAADQIRFSVVIPAYNEADFLGATLRSLADQDFGGRYEVIVVDNNCTDETAAVAAELGAIVVAEPEPGVCAARQRGTMAARGQIVVSTDADTVQPRNWLSRIDAAFSNSDSVVAVAGPCRYVDARWWARGWTTILFGAVALARAVTGRVLYITATNTAFARSAFPGYNTTLTQGGDELDLLRRLRPQGDVVWVSDLTVDTSPRRLQRGLLYTFFVAVLAHYLLAYVVNRLAARTVLGIAPAFRHVLPREGRQRRSRRRRWWVGLAVAVAACLAIGFDELTVSDAFGSVTRLLLHHHHHHHH